MILSIIAILMITVIVHELGHTIAGILCGVKVEAFGIGFGKPYIHKKLFGIDFRLSPWLLGGYTKFKGEEDKSPDGLLAQKYYKKVIILLSGVFMNIIVAFGCYLIHYKSISLGLQIDFIFLRSMFSKDTAYIYAIYSLYPNVNLFLLQLSVLNSFCAIFNLIPFPALDGGYLWLFLLEKIMSFKNFLRTLKYLSIGGMVILIILQVILVLYFLGVV